jgi:hypothetical protein
LVYAASAAREEKAVAFRDTEGIRWTEISINSMLLILQGKVRVIFGVAMAASVVLCRGLYHHAEYLPLCMRGITYRSCECSV